MYSFRRIAKGISSIFLGPRSLRRRTLHDCARLAAQFLGGHYVGEDYKLWLQDVDFASRFKALSPHNHFSMERKFALREFARSVKTLPGAAAECGTYTGVSAWFIAKELDGTDLFLFDSFEGLSAPSSEDRVPKGIQQWAEGDLAVPEDAAYENLRGFQNLHFMKGWIPRRFSEVAHLQFKLVHVDVDVYEPTRDSLLFFYERMVNGGIIVIDDYGFENCPGAYLAANEFMQNRPETIIHLPTGQGIIVRRCERSMT